MLIALQLRGDNDDWHYKFRPQHIIHDELCMVLQHRAFCLNDSGAVEIPLSSCHPHMNVNHVVVHELAFGPDSDTSVRGVTLYFNIPESAITEFTEAQAKRYRWKRTHNKKGDKKDETKPLSVFDSMDGFEMIRPHDSDAFDLATDIMKHRLEMMQAEQISAMKERHEALRALEVHKKDLQGRFEALRRHWITWAWPVNVGRKKVDRNTPVPKVDGHYEFEVDVRDDDSEEDKDLGSASGNVWNTFVKEEFDDDTVSGWSLVGMTWWSLDFVVSNTSLTVRFLSFYKFRDHRRKTHGKSRLQPQL